MILRSIALAACGAGLLAAPALGQSSRYSDDWRRPENQQPAAKPAGPAKPAAPRLHRLLRELDRITAEAERERAAHPRLLGDMRALVRRHARRWPRVILSENFMDRDLTSNPRWIVRSGEFSVGPQGLEMRTAASAAAMPAQPPQPAPAPPAQEERRPRIGEAIIGSILEELAGERRDEQQRDYGAPPAPQAAPAPSPPPAFAAREGRIRTAVKVPNAFVMRVTLWSHDNRSGAFEMGVGQGRRASGYRLVYRPGELKPLRLESVGRGGRTVIRIADAAVRLEDGKRHKLELARDVVGEMTVAVDDRQVMQLRDESFRDGFDNVVLRNRGGAYTLRGVAVYGTP